MTTLIISLPIAIIFVVFILMIRKYILRLDSKTGKEIYGQSFVNNFRGTTRSDIDELKKDIADLREEIRKKS